MSQDSTRDGDRIAKVIARAGLASRRDAEVMVTDLRVKVNGKTISNVAMNVGPGDKVSVDGKPLPRAEGARLWLYHKPEGLVTTARDEKGRETVFDTLPPEMGRVLSVGRLDLNSEGLLLLTNDGELKRQLELPSTGWLRRYRVRVNGRAAEAALDRLRAGMEVEGDHFAPMQVTLDRQQGANAWLTVGLREGRNREIRRAMAAVELYVNRLIRISYGPFQLGNLAPGGIEEVRPKVLRDQLGDTFDGDLAEGRKEIGMTEDDTTPPRGAKTDRGAGRDGDGAQRGRKPRPSGDRLVEGGRGRPEGGKGRSPGGPKGGKGRPGSKPGAPGAGRADRAARPDRPRTGKPPVTRNDGDDARGGDRPRREGRPEGGKRFAPKGDGPRGKGPGGDGKRPPRDGDGPKRDRRPGADRGTGDAPKETKSERTARLRQDSSISLRKGGQRGRGIAKPKKAPSTKRMRKPGEGDAD